MIFVTHTSSIASMADRIITLRSGKIESIVENKDKKEAKDIEW
jgi:putative ABC transport system ATP-binding protein